MDAMLTVILTRALERLLIVAVGALAVYIGYRLFVLMPLRKEGEGKLDLPGGVSIVLSRIGPGVFFALFGAGLIAYSAAPVSFKLPQEMLEVARQANAASGYAEYVGMTDQARAARAERVVPPDASVPREVVVETLNSVAENALTDLTGSQKLDADIAIREAKLALMREIWDETRWGDYAAFHRWVIVAAETGPPPDGSALAAAFYRRE